MKAATRKKVLAIFMVLMMVTVAFVVAVSALT
ncbi:hypothetical protein TALC_00769 [Thermoplasmatales archaeon BRNA1]|nr:hypothetical protein TALC_00769 [Thermoplasmatales archaeon BRNA1]